MGFSDDESRILGRFTEKCRIAGGPKAGYVLRRQSIEYGWDETRREAASRGFETLVEKGLLAANENGDRFVLTEQGVAALTPEDALATQ